MCDAQNANQKESTLKLYDVFTVIWRGPEKYYKSNFVAATDSDHACRLAKEYFQTEYDDFTEYIYTEGPNVFEFDDGVFSILEIRDISEVNLREWALSEIKCHCISDVPAQLLEF